MAYYRRDRAGDTLARGLGWFSIGLGVAELLAGRRIARWMGMEDRTELIRAYGVREIVSGVGLLGQDDPRPWMWGRVAGDMLDLATLASGLDDDNPRRDNVRLAMGLVTGAAALDLVCAGMLQREERAEALIPPRDYSSRSGLPRMPESMRGAAQDAPIPKDMRTPDILQFEPAGAV